MKYILILAVLSAGGIYWYGERGGAVISDPKPLGPAPPPPKPPPPPPPPPEMTQDVEREIREKLFDSNSRVRLAALERLAKFSGPAVDGLLSQQVRIDADVSIRMRTVRIMESRGPETGPPLIYGALRDTDKRIRITAIDSLRNLQAYESGDVITKMLFDTEADVRRTALQALNALARREITKTHYGRAYRLPPNFQLIYLEAINHARGAGTTK